jgi:hypothetical protein
VIAVGDPSARSWLAGQATFAMVQASAICEQLHHGQANRREDFLTFA